MPIFYDHAATLDAVDRTGLAPRCLQFMDIWFSGWENDQLPTANSLPLARFGKLGPLVVTSSFDRNMGTKVMFVGDDIARIAQIDLGGKDWSNLVPPMEREELARRAGAVAGGAILRAKRVVQLASGQTHLFEQVSVPFRPEANGAVTLASFFDWNPPDRNAVLLNFREILAAPEAAEFIAIRKTPRQKDNLMADGQLRDDERVKIISRAATRLVLSFIEHLLRTAPLAERDPTDYLIVIAIGGANVAHIEQDDDLSRQYSGLTEPDWLRKGVSRAAISRKTEIPMETVRRRVNKLIKDGIVIERKDGLILSSASRFSIAAQLDAMPSTAELVNKMVNEITARGVVLNHR